MVVHLAVTWQWNCIGCQVLFESIDTEIVEKIACFTIVSASDCDTAMKNKHTNYNGWGSWAHHGRVYDLGGVCYFYARFSCYNCRPQQNADNVKMIETFGIMRKWILSAVVTNLVTSAFDHVLSIFHTSHVISHTKKIFCKRGWIFLYDDKFL